MRAFIVAVAAAFAASAALAQPAPGPPPPPLEAYGALPSIDFMQLSPSGKRLAYAEVTGDARRLVVLDLGGKALFVGGLSNLKVRDIAWAGDDHVLVTTTATEKTDFRGEFAHVLSINVLTHSIVPVLEHQRVIFGAVFGYYGSAEVDGRWYGYFGGITLTQLRGFAPSLNPMNYADLYRVDLDTGLPQFARTPKAVSERWVVDNGQVIAHSEFIEQSGNWRLFAEKNTTALLSTQEPEGLIYLAGAGRTAGTVVVDRRHEAEEWDLQTGAHTPLTAREGPIDDFIYDPITGYLVGAMVLSNGRREQEFFEPTLATRLLSLKKGLGGSAELSSWSRDYASLIARTATEQDPGTYWLISGKEAKPVAFAYPHVPDASVGPVRRIRYRAADGLEMEGILTLPPGRAPKNLPLVVMPHGGPAAHDSVAFDWWAQAFASRGYAVFQPNFRGSDGYGVAFHDAGYGQWGRKMQTDISDGVADLARQGTIDPKRACIVGASYGGYAALAGVTVQQGLYRCAVAVAGLSDLNQVLVWLTLHHDSGRNPATRYWRQFMGVESDTDAALQGVSPLRLAAKADAPVLLIHGLDDMVVPVDQSRAMERALKAANKPVEMMFLKGEDHWLSTAATRTEMLKASVAFVQKNNPPD